MDLTQQTHGRLLAAFSFNNRYPSPPLLPPSIRSVISVCLFVSFFSQCVCFGLTFSFPSSSFPAFYTHTHLHVLEQISDTPNLIFQQLLLLQKPLFISPRCLAFTPSFNPFLSCSPSSSFHLSITAPASPIRSGRLSVKAQRLLPERRRPTQEWPVHSCLIPCYSNNEREEHYIVPAKFYELLKRIQTHKADFLLRSPVKVMRS